MNNLTETLGLLPGMSSYFAHAPAEYFEWVGLKTYTHRPDDDGTYQFIHAFFSEKDQLLASLGILASKLSEDGIMWISVPNGKDMGQDFLKTLAAEHYLEFKETTELPNNWVAYKFVVA